MPIFQDDFHHASTAPLRCGTVAIEPPSVSRQRQSPEDGFRTESCEGRVLDGPIRPTTPRNEDEVTTSDRAELIEMLKRGASPTWIPNRHLESMMQQSQRFSASKSPEPSTDSSASLLPPVQITPEKAKNNECVDERLQDGLGIERPRSALHSGDFTTDETGLEDRHDRTPCQKRDEQHVAPDTWLATSPPRDFLFDFRGGAHLPQGAGSFKSGASPLSSSLSSFVYQPPTSPLVQSETNEDLEFSMPLDDIQLLSGRSSSARRHTLHATYPSSFTSSPSHSPAPLPGFPNRRRERALPYQAHQPRRSLTGVPNFLQQAETSPQTPAFLRARRLSFGSDTSPLHHASMVGSYEESILRGRMSTTPSRPIDFLAQIGVLGKGKCKPSLRCPPHVTLPFPAVYYSYASTPHGRSRNDDGPSPYVGQIDLENGLPNPDEESRSRRKTQSRYTERRKAGGDMGVAMDDGEAAESECCKSSRPRRRSGSPKAPPGGSYRIPEQGQIQIILKNQNKTAVKLFLVPYDLTGMAPGTKTFIRQRSYSTGPIIDAPNIQANPMDHPILRYLVHLHICCPSRGRYYLYKSIRIVFANRVPDGKEKLRIETTWPDPRFTPYKHIRLMNPPVSTSSGSGAMLVAEKALRRRSLGLPVGAAVHPMSKGHEMPLQPLQSCVFSTAEDAIPAHSMPLHQGGSDSGTPTATTDAVPPSPSSPPRRAMTPGSARQGAQYEKLNKGDAGYGGHARGRPASGGAAGAGAGAEGLLSQRLRGLGVKTRSPPRPSRGE